MTIPPIEADVPLAPLTTLGIGGPARAMVRFGDVDELLHALDWAHEEGLAVCVLGGGSNLLVADRGFDGLLVQTTDDSVRTYDDDGRLRVGAGHDWDALVASTVAEGLAGIECLSGIPGLCGAAPIQNIGAYGQEVAEVLEAVEVVDLSTGRLRTLPAAACGLSYRWSHFKGAWSGRYCVVALHLNLRPGAPASLRYAELARRAADATVDPSDLAAVRALVLELRAEKSMLADPEDPDGRSAGSFFTNPLVSPSTVERVAAIVGHDAFPQWPEADGRVKLSAAWLIQNSGFAKGETRGRVGLSSRHVLALVNRGGATAADVLGLATEIRDRVLERFGIRLVPEPVPLGFDPDEIADLWGQSDPTSRRR